MGRGPLSSSPHVLGHPSSTRRRKGRRAPARKGKPPSHGPLGVQKGCLTWSAHTGGGGGGRLHPASGPAARDPRQRPPGRKPHRAATPEAQPKGRRGSEGPWESGRRGSAGRSEDAGRPGGGGSGFPHPESASLVLVEVGGARGPTCSCGEASGARPHPPLDRQPQRLTGCSPVPQGAGAGAGGGAKGASPRAASLPIGHITGLWLRLPRPL